MNIILGLLVILLGVLVGLLMYQNNSIKNQLQFINKEEKTNKLVTVVFHGLKTNALVTEINNLINRHKDKEIELEHEKNKIKSQITSISHDLRTPLTSIVGYIDLLEKPLSKEDKEKYLNILKKKSSTLQKLVEDFYEITLIEDINYTLEIAEVSPGYILEDVIMEYYNDFENIGLSLNINIEDYKKILGNQKALSRVYSNLLSNMKKHGGLEGEIFHGIKEGSLITVFKNKIKGNENLDDKRLFEKFYTGEKSRNNSSSGIGMYSSKVILEKMNFSVSAKIINGYMEITIKY